MENSHEEKMKCFSGGQGGGEGGGSGSKQDKL